MAIPPEAKKVFSGVIFDVYQWEQEMFDGSTETFERAARPDTVQVIATKYDKIIVVSEDQPGIHREISLLGGRVQANEEPLDAAKRELLEESGMQSVDWDYFATYKPASKLEWHVHYFIARNCEEISEPTPDGGERISVKYVDFDEFVTLFTGKQARAGEFSAALLRMQRDGELEGFKKHLFGSE
jgi:ADP-ribose pyrophosphatase